MVEKKSETAPLPLGNGRIAALRVERDMLIALVDEAERLGEIPFDIGTRFVESANRVIDAIEAA